MFGAAVGMVQGWFCACWDSCWVLYTCVFLALVIWMAWKTQHGYSWKMRMAFLGSTFWQRMRELQEEGARKQRVKQPRSQLYQEPPSHARQATRRHSIRQLLCDDVGCTLCNEAARQAESLVYTERAHPWVPAEPGSPPPPAASPKGRGLLSSSLWRGLSVLQWWRCGVSPVCDQPPAPAQGPSPPGRSPPKRRAGRQQAKHHPLGQAKSFSREQEECLFCSSSWHKYLLRRQEKVQSSSASQPEPAGHRWEQEQSSSASQPEPARHSWEQDQSSSFSQPEPARHSWEQDQSSSFSQPEPARHSWEQDQSSSFGHAEPARHSWEQDQSSSFSQPEPAHHSWEQDQSSSFDQPEPARHSWEQDQSSSSSQPEPVHPSWEQDQSSLSGHAEPAGHSWEQDQGYLSTHHAVSHTRWEQAQPFPASQPEPCLHPWRSAQSYSSSQRELPLLTRELRTESSQREMFLCRREERPGPSPAQPQPFPPSPAEQGWRGPFPHSGQARPFQATPQQQAHHPDWAPFAAKSPAGARMPGLEAKQQPHRRGGAPRAEGDALESRAVRAPAWDHPGALRVLSRIEFAEEETPFLQRTVRVSLERHIQVKRLQHALGLPGLLQRALKSFLPPAPKATLRRAPGAGRVVTQPQSLPFLSVGSRTELERHLERMVHLKRWGLPRRIQESLRLMKPAAPQRPKLGPPLSERRAPVGSAPVKRTVPMPSLRTKAPDRPSQGMARESGSAPCSLCCREARELQGHIARKGLEIRLGALPSVLRSSQKMATLGRKDLLLPKLIPSGCKAPLACHQLCPGLRRKAASVELNVKHKYFHFHWALPTLYTESLAKMAPKPPVPPVSSQPLAATIEFCHLETPFLARQGWELLERHVLRKRLQHEWGLPGLVRRSLRRFMPPPPTRPGPRASIWPAAMELRVSRGTPPISAATERELEAHIRRRVAERRWGLPRRVRESLRGFMVLTPTAPGRRRDTRGQRANQPLREPSGRRAPKKSPSRGAPVHPTAVPVSSDGPLRAAWSQQLSWDTCRWLLERHVARKNVEIRLGLIPRRAQHSQEATRWLGKLPLPRLIHPGQRSLQLRTRELLFLEQEIPNRLELNLLHKQLNFKWGLPTLYHRSLAKLFHTASSPTPPRFSARPAQGKLVEQGLPFLPPAARAELERHVQRKKLQHEWGLPLIIQKSIRCLQAAPPSPCQPQAPPTAPVAVVQPELSFLSESSRRELELSLRKRLMHRRWGLPRRIQESLRLLRPAAELQEFGPQDRVETAPGEPLLLPWPKSTAHMEQGAGKAIRVVSAPPPRLSLGGAAQERLQIHVAKKCVEIRLGASPAPVRRSWQALPLVSRPPLPKLTPAGGRAPKARSSLLPFVLPEDISHLELMVHHKHLTALWGLGTLYTQSLSRMVPRAPPGPVPPVKAEVEFSAQASPFLGPMDREALELHVRRKKLHHEWGLPLVIQKSIRCLQAAPPSPCQPQAPPTAPVAVVQPELSFLSESSRRELELSLRKRLMHRRWGLPRRIQESLRLLQPTAELREFGPQDHVETAPGEPLLLPWPKSTAHVEQGVGKAIRVVSAPPPRLSLGGAAQERLQIHVAKKCVEIRLGASPAPVRRSWQALPLVSRPPLPKLIPAGGRAPKARSSLLPFIRREDISHLELMVHHKHLTALWGLGTLYTQSLSRMVPRAPPGPVPPVKAEVEFSAQASPFLGPMDREALELHVRRKKLQHEWGLPARIARSLRAFAPEPLLLEPAAPPQRTEVHILILRQEPPLIDQGTRDHLEHHLRKMTQQRRWGLPRRIQESLRLFAALTPTAGSQLPGATRERHTRTSQLWSSQADLPAGSLWAGASITENLAAECRGQLQQHLTRKRLEIRLEVRPTLVKRSQRAAWEGEQLHLPRLLRAGQKPPQLRTGSPLGLPPEAVATLDMNVRHKCLAHLWGLTTLQAASLRRMMPEAPVVPQGKAAGEASAQTSLAGSPGAKELEKDGYKEPTPPTGAGAFELTLSHKGTPLLTGEARDHLESHVLRKKLQHTWGLPAVVQRSLGAFAPLPPKRESPSRFLAPAGRNVTVGSLLFLSTETRELLESHVRRLALERRWGLPKRIQQALRIFLEPAQPGAQPRGQTQHLVHLYHKPTQRPTVQSGEVQPGPKELLTQQSQPWQEMGTKEGKAVGPEAEPHRTFVSSSGRSQETSQLSDGEGPLSPTHYTSPERPMGSSSHFPEDEAQLTSTLDIPGEKVLGISYGSQESQRWVPRPETHKPHPQHREQSSEESPGSQRIHDHGGATWLVGSSRCFQSSFVETAVWNEKRISHELESSFRKMARSSSHRGPGARQPLAPEVTDHLEMAHCACFECPCCKLKRRDATRSPRGGSPVWQRQFISVRGSAALPRDTAAPSPQPARYGWQWQGTRRAAKEDPSASSLSSLEGSESRVSDWSAGESAHGASHPAPDEPSLSQAPLAPPLAATRRLDVHLAQKALGSFILPPCVIRSQAAYAFMAAERVRAAAQEHRREMNIQLQRRRGRKSQQGRPRSEFCPTGPEQPRFPSAETLGRRLIGESQSQRLCEMCHGLSMADKERSRAPLHPAEGGGKSGLDSGVCLRDRKTASDVCRGEQGASSQQSQVLGHAAGAEDGEGAERQTRASPSQPVARDNAGERGLFADSDDLVHPMASSQWPASSSEQRPQSAEGLSQFSTEGEWEMVGDWDSEAVATWDTEGAGGLAWKERRFTKGQHSMAETPAEETGPRAGTNMRQTESQGLTVASPAADQPPCEGKGPTIRGVMLGFLKRVTSRASVGQREHDRERVAATHGALPQPRKLAPSPRSVTFSAEVHMQAEVRRCQVCSSGEAMEGAGKEVLSTTAQYRDLPENGAPQGSGGAFTDAMEGEGQRGSMTREQPSPNRAGASADHGRDPEQAAGRATECRQEQACDPCGVPAAPVGPSDPRPPAPTHRAGRGTRTMGSPKGGGKGVTSLKVADSGQQGAAGVQGCTSWHVSTAGTFTSSPLNEQMVVIGLILEKKLGLRHGLYAWERSQGRSRALRARGSAVPDSNQPSSKEASRARPREQRGQGLSPSPPRGWPRSQMDGPWSRGRAKGAERRGLQARRREGRSGSRGRPTSRRRSRSRDGESMAREGVQDQPGPHWRPGQASSRREVAPANGEGGKATRHTSKTVGASNLQHRLVAETQLLQPGTCPTKSAGHVCRVHKLRAHAHLLYAQGRATALCGENLCALRERMQARRRQLSASLDSAASEEESHRWAMNKS